jgi:hypothetical protein
MEKVLSNKTLANFYPIGPTYSPEKGSVPNHRCENLTLCFSGCVWF